MGRSIPVEVGGRRFPTKGALTAYMRELVSRYSVGAYLDSKDVGFCLSLFKHHPEAESKFGVGITMIEVRRDEYGNKHFQIHRSDGSSDDISWVHCVRRAQ